MGLKTHAGQTNPNPNIKAQANTLSAKPLSPFKPKGTVKQTQTVGLSKPKQSQTKEPQPLSPSQEPTLSPSRRQFIEQYGAYALVTPVALYAMMSPNRAMAQAASVGVVVARPTVLYDQDRIENFDITTHIDGRIDEEGGLELAIDEKYIAPDGVVYTCTARHLTCYIMPTEGGGGYAFHNSQFDITYPDDIGSSNQAAADAVDDTVADTTDDPVVDARPIVLVEDAKIENYDVTTKTDGYVNPQGNLELEMNDKYIAPDGTAYICTHDDTCFILPEGDVTLG